MYVIIFYVLKNLLRDKVSFLPKLLYMQRIDNTVLFSIQ
jgi:hypothetical protein